MATSSKSLSPEEMRAIVSTNASNSDRAFCIQQTPLASAPNRVPHTNSPEPFSPFHTTAFYRISRTGKLPTETAFPKQINTWTTWRPTSTRPKPSTSHQHPAPTSPSSWPICLRLPSRAKPRNSNANIARRCSPATSLYQCTHSHCHFPSPTLAFAGPASKPPLPTIT